MKPVSEIHVRVIDKGLFLPIARRLARDAKAVTYFTPHERSFPTVRDCIGDGFDDIQRVSSPWHDAEDVDCWCFPDVGFSDLQIELLRQGKIVWGARDGDELELSRGKFLEALRKTGLPLPQYGKVSGITKLRDHLRDREDLWVKISRYRGDCETFHWRSWEEDESQLDQLAVRFGPYREHVVFYVFDPIDTEIEDGCDSYCIDGEFPSLVIHGMEAKDKAYLGAFQRFADLPEELRRVNEAFAPILRQYGYRSFFSTEVRITDQGDSYFIDPTCRAGSPPSQVMAEMIGNYGEIIWQGANGILVDPEPAAKFGVQAMVCLKGDPREWRTMRVTDELDRWLKCPDAIRVDDCLAFAPDLNNPSHEIGWLVGIGDRMGEPIRHLQHNVKLLPDGATCEFMQLASLIQEIEKAEAAGMPFTEQKVPSPEIVLEKT